ncbi:hypothetical protein BJV78DRAFT_688802 [Lactifluus subvellereus]|nr:hypothetical protein BJV78DRAFT_688802 [Lactifluus subvellereus]
MLRRAITGYHSCPPHRPWPFHVAPRRSFSTSLDLREEAPSRDSSQGPSSFPKASSSTPETDGPLAEEKSDNHALSDAPRDEAALARTSRSRTPATRSRTLRPLLIPPTFPPSLLLPVTPIVGPQKREEVVETDSSTTITLADLPRNTVKTDIRPIFQRFGEVTRIIVRPGGTRADVVFADAHGVKRTLHAYAEQLLRVRGQEIIVFRKSTREASVSVRNHDTPSADIAWQGSTSHVGAAERGDARGAIFVSNFPQDATREELWEALAPFGKYEGFVMRPDSKYAYFMYASDDRVEHILRVHRRIPITVRGQTLRLELAANRPYGLSHGLSAEHAPELGKTLDSATSSAVVEELKRTVPRWKGSYGPSRVLWIGRLPTDISRTALTNFWSRLGCVVEVRTSGTATSGFAHVEFANTEEALRAARHGAAYGFLPPFRKEQRQDPRSAFLHLQSIDDARAALRKLDGRLGPGGETLQLALSRLPALHPNRLWRWVYVEEELKRQREEDKEEAYFEDEWEGLGFGTEQDRDTPAVGLERGDTPDFCAGARERPPVGTRGGRRPWKDRAQAEAEDEDAVVNDSREHEVLWGDEELEDALQSTAGDRRQAEPNYSPRSQQLRTHASVSYDG